MAASLLPKLASYNDQFYRIISHPIIILGGSPGVEDGEEYASENWLN
jgi:hypothetical protein